MKHPIIINSNGRIENLYSEERKIYGRNIIKNINNSFYKIFNAPMNYTEE